MKHFRRISDLYRLNNLTPSAHPQISLLTCRELAACSIYNSEFTTDFYMITFKKIKSGNFLYGRTKYDHDNGSLMFAKPRQVTEIRDVELNEKGFIIYIHEDFLNGHPLHSEIRKYSFFEYETREALHLSPREEEIIWDLYRKIETEYLNNTDEYSRDIMLTHLDSILKYSQRFYKRQFIHRTEISGKMVSRFNESLVTYFESGMFQKKGLPTVTMMADQLNTSPRYLSDLLKQETGKTAMELIHIFLISEAKNMLMGSDQTVAETAYQLGFENPPYFSRLFKKEVGVSPVQFKNSLVVV
ncbi:helix-turn-helix domain-containing protein [Dyadobacter luticola]|uniref:Helix-turn-helix transcriptional regulator n=1 Tax=Dyadobacter luticola TaxID=1979387 RepID=A0A5R9L3N4_9BACT|nr:helix-turn-helix transcriptional regulator [Dyadobacter luticola]TLV03192.1 helix-turn-helix transcriptional regulator [Dyadobacter luticola]